MFVFTDRESMRPGRYKVTTDAGESYYITLKRADEPTVAGTPLNANTFSELQESIQGDISSEVSALQTKIKNGTVVAAKATSATKATSDGNGKNIANTYATIGDLKNEAELRGDLETDLRNGTIPVGRATIASTVILHRVSMTLSNGKGSLQLEQDAAYIVCFNGWCGAFINTQDATKTFPIGRMYANFTSGGNFTLFRREPGADVDILVSESGTVDFFCIGNAIN